MINKKKMYLCGYSKEGITYTDNMQQALHIPKMYGDIIAVMGGMAEILTNNEHFVTGSSYQHGKVTIGQWVEIKPNALAIPASSDNRIFENKEDAMRELERKLKQR